MADDFISDEDKALFHEHMRSVTPLNEKNLRVTHLAPKPPIPSKRKEFPVVEQHQEYYLSDTIQENVMAETTLSYSQTGLNNQRFKELRMGRIHWESRLDLHGLKSENARDVLCQFIDAQIQQDRRCVLIVHGKGGHHQGESPIIKNLVNRWLPQLEQVIAFHSALPRDGGTGAIYVLLKRNRGG